MMSRANVETERDSCCNICRKRLIDDWTTEDGCSKRIRAPPGKRWTTSRENRGAISEPIRLSRTEGDLSEKQQAAPNELSSAEARDTGFRSTASAFFHCVTRTTNCSTEHDCSLSFCFFALAWRRDNRCGTNFSLQIQKKIPLRPPFSLCSIKSSELGNSPLRATKFEAHRGYIGKKLQVSAGRSWPTAIPVCLLERGYNVLRKLR